MEITKIFDFDAAHQLKWHDGKCKNLHGHTYKLEVTVAGKPDHNGVVMDFSILKKVVNEWIIEEFDHRYTNHMLENPTAENMIQYIKDILHLKIVEIAPGCYLKRLRLWETPTSFVTLNCIK